jgi:hypothetical protein
LVLTPRALRIRGDGREEGRATLWWLYALCAARREVHGERGTEGERRGVLSVGWAVVVVWVLVVLDEELTRCEREDLSCGSNSAGANQHNFVQQWSRNINAAYDDENEPA